MVVVSTQGVEQRAGIAVRLDAWRAVFEKTNRIVTGRAVTVSIADKSDIPHGMDEVPGWSDGETIHFNGPLLLDMLKANDTVNAVLRLKGLNYHELSHVLYTPRQSDELPKRIVQKAKDDRDSSWWYAFNALEDQRIETWFTSVYGPSRRYFEAAVLEWLVKSGNTEAAILTYGRKYLPSTLRVKAGRVFIQKHGLSLYAEFQKVIDEYIGIILPRDTVKAYTLIVKYRELLKKMQAPAPALPVPDNGCHPGAAGAPGRDDVGVIRAGRVSQSEQEDAAEAAAEKAEEVAEADAAVEAAMDAADAAAKAEQDATDAKADGTGTGSKPGDLPADGKSATADGDGGGQGAGTDRADHKVLEEAMADLIEDAFDGLKDIQGDDDIREDVGDMLDAVRHVLNNGEIDAAGPLARNKGTVDADETTRAASNKVAQVLRRIKVDAEPETLRRQVSGRLDVRRVMTRQPHELDIYTQWDEGSEDMTGIEAVILLDVSGSMQYRMASSCAAVWALKKAFDKLEIRTTCLVFDHHHSVLFRPQDKVTTKIPQINSGGGTNPQTALVEAHKILSKSDAPNKVLVTVTDGEWTGDERSKMQVMKSMDKLGVSSLILGLDGAVSSYGKHYHQDGYDLASINALPKAVGVLVSRIMRQAISRD